MLRFTARALALIALVIFLFGSSYAASNGKLIYSFTGGNDGGDPATQLAFDTAGNAYGTTVTGGNSGCGTVFKLVPVGGGWRESTLYSFTCLSDGKNPYGGVTLDAAGNLYGTTVAGGSGGTCAGDGCGTVYELSPSGNGWSETVLYNFTGGNDGSGPGGSVVFDNDGNLYGSTPDGGAYSMGVVYELSPVEGSEWQQTVIHAFSGGNDGGVGSLGTLLYTAGKFYGISEIGGEYGAGTVFLLYQSNGKWNFQTIHAFEGQPHAGFPYGGLTIDNYGVLYGTTYYGGVYGMGAVFALDIVNNRVQEIVIHSFKGGTDGSLPTSTPAFDAAHNLYGTTSTGGLPACDCGTVFEVSLQGNRLKEKVLHSFASTPDGAYPSYGLTFFNKAMYGSTPVGGAKGQGMIFTFAP